MGNAAEDFDPNDAAQWPVPNGDRWLLWPTAAIFAAAFCAILLCGIPGLVSLILIPLVALGSPIAAIGLLLPAGVLALRRKYRKAVSITVAVLLPMLLWKPIAWAADCTHIALTVGFGGGQLGMASVSPDGHFATYDWSVGLAGGPNTFLIYDVTDAIALPPPQQKVPVSSETGLRESCAGKVDHLVGHYFRCQF